jgi:hypothetical protein
VLLYERIVCAVVELHDAVGDDRGGADLRDDRGHPSEFVSAALAGGGSADSHQVTYNFVVDAAC